MCEKYTLSLDMGACMHIASFVESAPLQPLLTSCSVNALNLNSLLDRSIS